MSDGDIGDRGGRSSLWRRAAGWVGRASTVLAALLALWIIWVLGYETFRKHGIEIEAIAVPKALVDDGFTADVAARRLRDAVRKIEDRAQTTLRKPSVEVNEEVDQEIPEITIHEAGVPVASMSRSIRRWLPDDWRHEVSGEFTRSGSMISLRLRLNGHIIFLERANDPDASRTLTAEHAIDRLIDSAASKVVELIQPSLAAIYLYYSGDSAAAEKLATRIVFEKPSGNEDVARAYNLKGMIAASNGDYARAREFYLRSKMLAVSKLNLGLIYFSLGHTRKALAEFLDANLLDNGLAQAHVAVGSVWEASLEQSRLRGDDAARDNPPEAFWLDSEFGYASVDVQNISQGTLDDIIAEYRIAAWLDPTFPLPHEKLGNLLKEQRQWAEAAVELRTAIRIDRAKYELDKSYGRELVQLQVILAEVLQAGDRRAEAIDSLNEAIRLDPEEPNLRYLLGLRLKEFADSADSEPERSSNFRSACAAVVEAAKRIGSDKGDNSLIGKIDAGIAAIDAALKDGSRCPPKSGAAITIDWEQP